MRVVVVTPPAPVVTWEEAQAHLRLDGDDEKTFVESLIAAATGHIDGPDGWLGRSVGVQALEARMSGFGVGPIRLPFEPILNVVSVHYLDGTGTPVLVDASTYELFGSDLGTAWGKSWPTPGAYRGQAETVRIQYRVGYEEAPAPIKAAILLMVGDLHRFRSTASDMNITPTAIPMSTTVEALLAPYRIYR